MPGEQDFIARLITLFETWPDAMFILAPDSSIVACNRCAQKLAGLGKGDLFAMPVGEIFKDDLLVRSLEGLSGNAATDGLSLAGECCPKGGGPIPVSIEMRTFESDGADYILMFARDLREEVRNREEIGRLKSALKHSRKLESVGSLVGGIIHYYNNIFTGLIAALDMAQQNSSATVLPILKRAKRAAGTASGYTKRLLAFTRDEPETVEPADIGVLIDDIRDFSGMTFDKRIKLDSAYDSDLKAVIADPTDLHHMLLNLIVNARDAVMDKLERIGGGGETTISVNAENVHIDKSAAGLHPDSKTGDYVLITVSDSGAGMDERTKQRIFDPYFTTKESGKGTGIGLAAVLETVTDADGWIELDSEPGKGSVFKIYLPSVTMKETVARREEEHADMPAGAESVVIVDDDDMIRTLGTMTLERLGYTVHATANATDCLETVMRNCESVELLILDLSLPDRPGEELLNDIRRLKADIAVIVTSGRDFAGDKAAFETLRADDYLTKPFTIGALAVSVRNTLDRLIKQP